MTVNSLQSRTVQRHGFTSGSQQHLRQRHSQFSQRAAMIARDIRNTAAKLEQLGTCER